MWFQNPDFLLLTRKYLLTEQNVQRIVDTLQINQDTRILDVGCGSGELTRRLSDATGCYCVGADLDDQLIAYAKRFETDRLKFFVANALQMPFEDSSFDIVISHTFLTTIFDAESALLEMQRICTPDGTICAINTDTLGYMPNFHDSFASCDWFVDYWKYKNLVDGRFHKTAINSVYGLQPEMIPQFFVDNGMPDVKLYQLPKLFSLNDLAASERERIELIELDYHVNADKAELLSPEERAIYLRLLQKKKDCMLGSTAYRDFTSGASLMVVSKNRKHPEALQDKQKKYRMIEQIEAALKKQGVDFDVDMRRADIVGISSVKITSKKHNICVQTAQVTPLEAMFDAYGKFFALLQNEACEASGSLTEQLLSQICDASEVPFMALRLQGAQHSYSCDGKMLSLDDAFAKWCLPKPHIAADFDSDVAFTEALYDALATFAFKQALQKQPTLIHENQFDTTQIATYLNLLKRYGYQIKLFDISCGSGIPAVALQIFNESGSLIRYSADFELATAVKKCLMQMFIGKKLKGLLSGSIRVIGSAIADVDLFNLIRNGKNVLPRSFVAPAQVSELAAFMPQENALQALKALCDSLSVKLCSRQCKCEDLTAVEVILADARMLWPFSRKRLNEFFYTEGIPSLLSKLQAASPAALTSLANYMEGKLRWDGENTLRSLTDQELQIPILGVSADYRLLLSSVCIALEKFDVAAKYVPTHTPQLKCLKHLLNRVSAELLSQLFDSQSVADAQAFLANPLAFVTN